MCRSGCAAHQLYARVTVSAKCNHTLTRLGQFNNQQSNEGRVALLIRGFRGPQDRNMCEYMIVTSTFVPARTTPQHEQATATRISAKAARISGPEFLQRAQQKMMQPLKVIQNLPKWMLDDIGSGTDVAERLEPNFDAITQQAKRVERIIAGMADFDGIRYHAKNPTMFCAVERLKTLIADRFPDGPFSFEILGHAPMVNADGFLFDTIFDELIKNAVIHCDDPDAMISILVEIADSGLQITVLDCGPGIPVEQRTRIFEPFETLQSADEIESAGIGLAKVVRAAGLINATLDVGDRVDRQGTAITLSMPIQYV